MQTHTTRVNLYISKGNLFIMAKDEKVEHKHEDGTKHSHVGGDKEHTHTKSSSCDCARMNGSRNPFCKVHGEKQYKN